MNAQTERAISDSVSRLGIVSLREKQLEAIIAFTEGHDTFVSLPTGYGKSMIYGILPYIFDNLRGDDNTVRLFYL